ncbi:uncharacterized protein ACWYII_007802 isoform 1-T2 [Salvelinus alpinus]
MVTHIYVKLPAYWGLQWYLPFGLGGLKHIPNTQTDLKNLGTSQPPEKSSCSWSLFTRSLVEMDTTIIQGRTFPCIQVEACYQHEHGALHVLETEYSPEPSDQLPAISPEHREVISAVGESAGPWNSRSEH